jgi:hypothetical protein
VRTQIKSHTDSTILHYANGEFAQTDAKTFDFTDNKSVSNDYRNVLQFLQTNVAGLIVSGNTSGEGDPLIYWRPVLSLRSDMSMEDRYKRNSPDFFVNEQLLNDGINGYHFAVTTISSIRVQDIAMIRAYPPGTFPATAGSAPNGVIAIWLKDGSENKYEDYFNKIIQQGYSNIQNFGEDNITNSVLYWNPNLETDSLTHTAAFNFHNKTGAKKFRIVIEGMDSNGRLLRLEQEFVSDMKGAQ